MIVERPNPRHRRGAPCDQQTCAEIEPHQKDRRTKLDTGFTTEVRDLITRIISRVLAFGRRGGAEVMRELTSHVRAVERHATPRAQPVAIRRKMTAAHLMAVAAE